MAHGVAPGCFPQTLTCLAFSLVQVLLRWKKELQEYASECDWDVAADIRVLEEADEMEWRGEEGGSDVQVAVAALGCLRALKDLGFYRRV